jgi:excisionase family DNA binding protein
LLTVAEAADYLRVSRQTVRALVHRGYVPAVKAGPAVKSPIRIRRDELERWLYGDTEDAA